ncbi:MAG: DUF4845 domain-containing protein, partial [Candidatus Dadabacteria bacterium]
VVYLAFKIIPIYYNYFEMQNQMDAAVKVASVYNDQELRKKLLYHLKKLNIPADPEDLKIVRELGTIKISLEYTDTLSVSFKDKEYQLWKFHFSLYSEGPYKDRKDPLAF